MENSADNRRDGCGSVDFIRCAITDLGMEPDGVVPADPLGRGGHDVDEFGPVSAVDQLGFVDRIERFGHGVVVGVAPRTDRGYNVVVGQSVGVVNGPVLHTTIAVMDQSVDVVAGTPPGGQGHGHSVGGQ